MLLDFVLVDHRLRKNAAVQYISTQSRLLCSADPELEFTCGKFVTVLIGSRDRLAEAGAVLRIGAGINMSSGEARTDASLACAAARCSGAREALVVLIMLYGLAQGTEALGGDTSSDVIKNVQPIVGGTPLSLAFLPNKSASNDPQFSAFEFSRRRAVAPDASKPANSEIKDETQTLRLTSAWQRLADYRSQGRVQLLTLWESQRSTVSLQAGHHGGPSLQWSSRIMNHGGATRGLLDRFVPSSLGAAGLGPKALVHSANSPIASKTFTPLPVPKSP